MASVTLATLRARARERADMPIPGFIADSANGIDAWINEGNQRLHELLIKAYGEQFLEKSSTSTTVNGTTDYTLPSDFMVLYGVDLTVNGADFALLQLPRTERALYKNRLGSTFQERPRYQVLGMQPGTLRLLPAPSGAFTMTFRYAPVSTLLVATTDAVNYPNGWERYIVIYTAIQMKMKQEDDVNALRQEISKMESELEEIAQRRNADQAHQVVDLECVAEDIPVYYV